MTEGPDATRQAESRRVYLSDAAPEDLQAPLDVIEEVFERGWMQANPSHPIARQWATLGWTSTVELLHLGVALERARGSVDAGRWRRMARSLKDRDLGNARGALWEVCALGLFDPVRQQARLAASSEPGFDLHVTAEDGTLAWVSCKSLGPSKYAREFRMRAEAVWASLRDAAPPGCHAQILLEEAPGRDRSLPSCRRLGRAIAELMTRPRSGDVATCHPDVMNARVLLLPWEARHAPPWAGASSTRMVVGQPMHVNEQRRLHDKLAEAARKFDLVKVSGESVLRAVMVRLPTEIDRVAAVEYARNWLETRDAGSVDGVLLYRAVVAAGGDLLGSPDFVFAHEIDWLTRSGVGPSPWHLELPVGVHVANALQTSLFVGGQAHPMSGAYLFVRGDETIYVPGGPEVHVELPRSRPDERVRVAIGGGGPILEARHPPSSELLIL